MASKIQNTEASFTSLTANGQPKVETTTELTLTFSPGVPELAKVNFGIGGAVIDEVKDTSGDGTTYSMKISDITLNDGEELQVSVAVIPKGYTITPQARNVAICVLTYKFELVSVNGESDVTTTDTLTLKFTPALCALKATDFTAGENYKIISVTELPQTRDDKPVQSVYEMKIQQAEGNVNGNVLYVSVNSLPDVKVLPNQISFTAFVHMPRRTWVQGINSNAGYNLDNSYPTVILFPTGFEDDSDYAKLDGKGIVISEAGDYEFTVSLSVVSDKSGAIHFSIGGGYTNNGLLSFSVSAESGVPATVTKSVILPDCPKNCVLQLSAVSQYKATAVRVTDASMSVKAIPQLPLPAPAPKQPLKGATLMKKNYTKISAMSLENKGGFDVKIKIRATFTDENGTEVTGDGYLYRKYYTNPNTHSANISGTKVEVFGKDVEVPEGATVQIIADVAGGSDPVGKEKYEFSSSANKTAEYKITGTTISSDLHCLGVD
jgi:hypothetical protein